MSLESKAKTVNELLIYVHDAQGFIGLVPGQGEKLVEYGKQKWVPLETAQKLYAQIETANKILDDFLNARILYAPELYQKLRACLSQSVCVDKTKEK